MMITLERDNVVKIKNSEAEAERLEAIGFRRVKEEKVEPEESGGEEYDTGADKQNRGGNKKGTKAKG